MERFNESQGGDYETTRELEQNELRERGLAILALGTVDMPYLVPVDPMDELNCDSCQ